MPGPGVLEHQDTLAKGNVAGAELVWRNSAQPDPHRVPRAHPHPPSFLHVLQLSQGVPGIVCVTLSSEELDGEEAAPARELWACPTHTGILPCPAAQDPHKHQPTRHSSTSASLLSPSYAASERKIGLAREKADLSLGFIW